MQKLVSIDVGGTSIKYGLWDENTKQLSDKGSIATPDNIEDFYQVLQQIKDNFKDVDGIGMSIPGAVDQRTGVIGGISAIPYIHNFPIQKELEARLETKITMENDANCAALAEVSIGTAKDMNNVLFVVIGTGVGGAVVINRQIVHGSHLYGGEFGMMLALENQQLSKVGTAVHLGQNYNDKYDNNLSGREVLELAYKGDKNAMKEVQKMYDNLAHVIYNIQFGIDPEAIIIGGGVSANTNFIKGLNQTLQNLMINLRDIPITPQVKAAELHNDANLVGAAYNFYN
ncbi:Glucokinase [Pediococcus pentosaceus]|uniref:Glucokinase n=2 Tax=Pediococcus pentosaceus TaxID=1255 RepID=A0A1Y0W1D7_PEDPE|nr:Glucokinase [Pediococcus pentosaceus]